MTLSVLIFDKKVPRCRCNWSYILSHSNPEWYELQFVMKEYCFNRCDRLVASSLLTLLQTLDLGGSTPLMRGQTSSAVGWSVLHILSQRLVTNEVERE